MPQINFEDSNLSIKKADLKSRLLNIIRKTMTIVFLIL